MLQKDGEIKRKGFKQEFKEEFDLIGKKNTRVVFKLVNSIYNGKDRIPRSYSIPVKVTVFEKGENGGDSTEYVYYKQKREKNVGGVKEIIYSPGLITFGSRGDLSVDVEKESDLFIFLMKHNRRASGANGEGSQKAIFYLEDKVAESKERVAKKSAGVQMQKYLFDPEQRLSDDKLRIIAQALRVPDIDDETDIEFIQVSIEEKVKKNPQLFLNMREVNDEVIMRSNLQLASEKGIISFNNKTYRWILNNTDSGNKADLAIVKKTENTMTALVYWLKNLDDNDHYGKIVELLTGKPNRKKKTKKVENLESEKEIELKIQQAKNEELRLKVELAKATSNSVEESKKDDENYDLPFLEDLDIDVLKEKFAKPHKINYSHLSTPQSIIKNLNARVKPENKTWRTKTV